MIETSSENFWFHLQREIEKPRRNLSEFKSGMIFFEELKIREIIKRGSSSETDLKWIFWENIKNASLPLTGKIG